LVVHKLDRFARNARITLEYLEKLEKAGVGFVSISEQMDFSSPMGKVMLANLAAFGQYYSDNLSTEVSKGLKERAMQGLWNGPVPFGYANEDGKLVPVAEEAEVPRRIFEMYASGTHTDQSIATWLNQTDVHPRYRRRRTDREYLWTRDSVKALPASLASTNRIQESQAAGTRTFVREMGFSGPMKINGKSMDMNRIDETVKLNDTEIWEVTNRSDLPHPFLLAGREIKDAASRLARLQLALRDPADDPKVLIRRLPPWNRLIT